MEELFDNVYFRCTLISIAGVVLNILKNMNTTRILSKIGNIKFSVWEFLKEDVISIAINVVSQVMVFIYIHDIVKFFGKDWAATLFIGVCAYFGSEFISEVFGSAKKLVKKRLDEKTTVADQHTNPEGTPTPLK